MNVFSGVPARQQMAWWVAAMTLSVAVLAGCGNQNTSEESGHLAEPVAATEGVDIIVPSGLPVAELENQIDEGAVSSEALTVGELARESDMAFEGEILAGELRRGVDSVGNKRQAHVYRFRVDEVLKGGIAVGDEVEMVIEPIDPLPPFAEGESAVVFAWESYAGFEVLAEYTVFGNAGLVRYVGTDAIPRASAGRAKMKSLGQIPALSRDELIRQVDAALKPEKND